MCVWQRVNNTKLPRISYEYLLKTGLPNQFDCSTHQQQSQTEQHDDGMDVPITTRSAHKQINKHKLGSECSGWKVMTVSLVSVPIELYLWAIFCACALYVSIDGDPFCLHILTITQHSKWSIASCKIALAGTKSSGLMCTSLMLLVDARCIKYVHIVIMLQCDGKSRSVLPGVC